MRALIAQAIRESALDALACGIATLCLIIAAVAL